MAALSPASADSAHRTGVATITGIQVVQCSVMSVSHNWSAASAVNYRSRRASDAGGPSCDPWMATDHPRLYSQCVLTIANRLDVMNRLGRAMADPTRARILMSLLEKPRYPGELARGLGLTRSNVSNHLTCLRGCGIVAAAAEGRQTRYEIADAHLTRALEALVDVVLAVDHGTTCADDNCSDPLCCVSAP